MRHLGLGGLSALVSITLLGVFSPGPARAGDCYWIHDPNAPGDWYDESSWDPSVPNLFDSATIDNGGAVEVALGHILVRNLRVGDTFAGSVRQSAGSETLSVLHDFWVGYGAGSSGTYILAGGWLSARYDERIGYQGTGRFRQSEGTNYATALSLAWMSGSEGTYALEGGRLIIGTGHMAVGKSGAGRLTQTGGANSVGGNCHLGQYAGATGAYELRGGRVNVVGDVVLGEGWATTGLFQVTGGTLDTGGTLVLARGSVSRAELGVSARGSVVTQGLTINQGEDRSTKVIVEVALNRSSLIHTRGSSSLAGVLDVQSLWGYRPREGQEFTIIACSGITGPYFSGNFSTITSNITLALQGLPAFAGAASGSDYLVTFQGLSAGDANGDHAVDGGDLAVMGSTWWQTGKSWGDCDFNGDGTVDGGDIALMGGNWMWTLPPAPDVPLPEPASAGLLMSAGLALIGRRRRT